MEKLSEFIDFIKEIKKNTPNTDAICKNILIKDGTITVFKHNYATTANIMLNYSGSQYLFQIEALGYGRVAVYPPDGSQRSVLSQFFDIDCDISCLNELKTDHKLIDMLIRNIRSLH